MYPVTSAVQALFEAGERQVLRITGTDRNGRAISITDADVMVGGFNIDHYSCNGEKLEIGTCISGEMTLKLNNADGRFDGVAFEGSELFVEVGVADWSQENPTVSYIPCGYFTPDRQPRKLTTISINALDRTTRFDAVLVDKTVWTDNYGNVIVDENGNDIVFESAFTFPCTVANLVEQICAMCYVPFTQTITGLPNATYQLAAMPKTQQRVTLRNLIQWCAGVMGTNAWIDWTGSLRFSWYGAATGFGITTENRYSSDLYEEDVTITGVAYTNAQNVTIVSGSPAYALDLTGNYIAADGIAQILPAINTAVNGFTYRPFEARVLAAPYFWPMDMMTFTDKGGTARTVAVTNVNFGINGLMTLAGKGETSQTNSYAQPSGVNTETAMLIDHAIDAAEQAIEDSLTQEAVFNILTDNGASQGIYLYNGQIYVNASYIQTGTLSANVLKGIILTLGGLNNADGQLVVKDASGNTIGTWNKDGITILQGALSAALISGGTLTLGGSGNNPAQLIVKDTSDNTIGSWNENGITLSKGTISDANGANSWNLTTGALNLNGTITTAGSDASGNEYKTVLENGIMTFYYREDATDPWTAVVSVGIRNDFAWGLMPPTGQSGSVALNASVGSGGTVTGGAYVQANTSGDISLRGSGIKVGPLDSSDPNYQLGGYDGYTGTVTINGHTIEIIQGIIVDVT